MYLVASMCLQGPAGTCPSPMPGFTWQEKTHLVSSILLNMMMCKQNENHLQGADRLPAITPRCAKSI